MVTPMLLSLLVLMLPCLALATGTTQPANSAVAWSPGWAAGAIGAAAGQCTTWEEAHSGKGSICSSFLYK